MGEIEGSARCSRCRETKPSSEFWRSQKAPNGLQSRCKACSLDADRLAYQGGTRQKRQARKRFERYGLTADQYASMYDAQGGKCAICTVAKDSLDIDHNHETGIVRALLCNRCNTAIGLLEESPDRMLTAAAYVLQHEDVLTKVGD